MKKIICLILMVLLLPTFPVFAADNAAVFIDNFVDISGEMFVSVKTANESFSGAEIIINNKSTLLEGAGAGCHSAYVDLSHIERAGEYEVLVISDFGGVEETFSQTITVTKMKATKTEQLYGTEATAEKLYHTLSSDGGFSHTTWESLSEDNKEFRIVFNKSLNDMGLNSTDIRIGNTGMTTLQSEGLFVFEGEVMFQNDPDDTESREKPLGSLEFYFRQGGKIMPTGHPINGLKASYAADKPASGREKIDEGKRNTLFFHKNGTLPDGSQYYTNTWYKYRFVFDAATKRGDGLLKGGARYFVSEMVNGEYEPFKMVTEAPEFTMYEITNWRCVPAPADKESKGFTVNFKNMSYTCFAPQKSWYVDSAEADGDKAEIKLSEDMGALTKADFKVLNEEGEEIIISAVEKGDEGEYVLTFQKSLFPGREYDLLIKNDLLSPGGASAFLQPEEDTDGNGYWKAAGLTAKSYNLNIQSISKANDHVLLTFENEGVSGKYISVSWFDENGIMVDFALSEINAETTSPLTISRTNSKAATEALAYVIDLSVNGAVKLYDIN